jgi:hypothetical protein
MQFSPLYCIQQEVKAYRHHQEIEKKKVMFSIDDVKLIDFIPVCPMCQCKNDGPTGACSIQL